MADGSNLPGAPTESTPDFANAQYTPLDNNNINSANNAYIGADMQSQEDGDSNRSIFDRAGDYVVKGLPLTATAVVNSFVNTAAEVGNFFGADFHKATIEDEFGQDSSMTAYYNANKSFIEGSALLAGSLLPGLGAVKAVKAVQISGKLGEAFSTATGLMSGIRDSAITEAIGDAAGNAAGNSLFAGNTIAKAKAIAAGVGDSALQGAIYQTATLATMHASPLLDNNTIADDWKDVLSASVQFGVLGGIGEGFSALRQIKAGITANDQATKLQEIVGAKGLGNLTPGDRIVGLISQQKEIEIANNQDLAAGKVPSVLAQRKLEAANNVVTRQLNAHFDELAGGNDPDLADSFQRFVSSNAGKIITDHTANVPNMDPLVQQLGQLSKIGRIDDTRIATAPTDSFYVPAKVDVTSVIKNGKVALPDITSKVATKETGTLLSKALQLKNPNIQPVVAHAFEPSDTSLISLADVGPANLTSLIPKYKNVQDAYSKGVDIFIDANGGTHINLGKDSALTQVARPGEGRILTKAERVAYAETGNLPANSKPLNSSALFLNLKDGTYFGEAPLPVVGDLGKVRQIGANILKIGDDLQYKFEPPSGQEFTPANPLAANAEYVWNSLRGIKDEDVINPEHLPQLEALYNDMAAHEAKGSGESYAETKDVSYSDGTELPNTASDLLQHISELKQQKIAEYIQDGKNADEIGHLVNATQSFLANPADGLDASKVLIPASDHTQINTIRLAYDIGTTKDNLGNIMRGMQATNYRYQLAVQANTDATAKMLNEYFGPDKAPSLLSNMKVTKTAGDATLIGAGEGPVFAANSDYGTLGQQFERVGRTFQDLQVLRHAAINEALAPAAMKIKNNPALAAEWGNFTFVRHSTGENYVFLPDAVASKYGLDTNTAVLEGAVTYKKGQITDWSKDYKPDGFNPGGSTGTTGLKTFYQLSPEVADLERAHAKLLAQRNDVRSNFYNAQGLAGPNYNPDVLYAPPINTARTPFFAYVKERDGTAMGRGGAHMMVAKDAADLRRKISLLPENLVAYTRDNIKEFKQAAGEYDFNRNFTSLKVKTDMARAGLLTNLVPETRADNLISDLMSFHRNQETQVLRDYTELHNAEIFAKLDAMGERFQTTANSSFGNISRGISKQLAADNPYASYTRTALGVSSKDNYPFWGAAQDKLEAFGNTAFNAVQQAFGALRRGIISSEEATKVSQRFGLGNPYGDIVNNLKQAEANYYGGLANRLPDKNIVSKVTGTANSILGATIIRIDAMQQFVHAVTLPIMTSMEHAAATKGMRDLLTTTLPDGSKVPTQIPAFSKTFYNAIRNYFSDMRGPNKGQLSELYSRVGMPKDQIFAYRQMIDELSVPQGSTDKATWLAKMQRAGDIAETLSGTKLVNSFNHFMAADIGRQIGEAKGLTGQDLIDHIGTFSNRVLGNLTAGQRGALFHGPVGQAIGLFQSYQFNLMQQVFRHIEEGNYKALAMGAGLQSTIFGLSSLPGFSHLNSLVQQHTGGDGNDLYSTATNQLGKGLADYLLYGAVSGLTGTALYSRGDVNPRRATIVPVNPLDIPSVAAGIRIYQNIAQLANNVANKGNVPASVMFALEHNGLSRPLTGLTEMMQGFATDSKGNIVSNISNPTMGWSDYFGVANMSRIFGARPLDESIALDAMYRSNAAQQADTVKLEQLGQAFKTQLYGNDSAAPDTVIKFANQYAADGGDINNFNKWMIRQTTAAHTPVVNKVFGQMYSNPSARAAMVEMGGVPEQSYTPQNLQPAQTE